MPAQTSSFEIIPGEVCIGTDAFHTSPELYAAAVEAGPAEVRGLEGEDG